MKPIRAVLFDMDGLLLDTEQLNMRCAKQTAHEMGFEIDTAQLARRVCGVTRANAIAAYASALPPGTDAERFYMRKVELIHQFREHTAVQPMKGAKELLEWLNAHGIMCVLATATSRESAQRSLEGLGMWELLPYRVTGDAVTKPKPDPETYQKAAQAAGVPIEACLVLEDSFNGIRSGRAAGAIVGMVPDTLPYDEQCAHYCDVVFTQLNDVIDWLKN